MRSAKAEQRFGGDGIGTHGLSSTTTPSGIGRESPETFDVSLSPAHIARTLRPSPAWWLLRAILAARASSTPHKQTSSGP